MLPNLYDAEGHRKYLTADEREAFLKAAEHARRKVPTFCGTLLYTGPISEALCFDRRPRGPERQAHHL